MTIGSEPGKYRFIKKHGEAGCRDLETLLRMIDTMIETIDSSPEALYPDLRADVRDIAMRIRSRTYTRLVSLMDLIEHLKEHNLYY